MERHRPSRALVGALLVAGLVLAGCVQTGAAGPSVASLESADPAASSPVGSTPPEADPQDAMLAYAECMREHGIDMPDPQFSADGGGFTVIGGEGEGMDFESDEFQAAQEACQEHLDSVRPNIDPAEQAEMQEQALAYAECMREHGIDMPDPQLGQAGGVRIGGPGDEEAPRFDPESPEFQDAHEACADELGDLPGPGLGTRRSGDE